MERISSLYKGLSDLPKKISEMLDFVRVGYDTTKRNIRENGYRTAFGMNGESLAGFTSITVFGPAYLVGQIAGNALLSAASIAAISLGGLAMADDLFLNSAIIAYLLDPHSKEDYEKIMSSYFNSPLK